MGQLVQMIILRQYVHTVPLTRYLINFVRVPVNTAAWIFRHFTDIDQFDTYLTEDKIRDSFNKPVINRVEEKIGTDATNQIKKRANNEQTKQHCNGNHRTISLSFCTRHIPADANHRYGGQY